MTGNQMRKLIGDVGFEYNIRVWKDGAIWVTPQTKINQLHMTDRLTSLGFSCKIDGRDAIIEVSLGGND